MEIAQLHWHTPVLLWAFSSVAPALIAVMHLKSRGATLNSVTALRLIGHEAVLAEVERLSAGGEVNETLMRRMSAHDRVVFEVALIDRLSTGPSEEGRRLRATLIKNGYDERWARRAVRGGVCDRVRASTLLRLIKAQSTGALEEPRS
jgi:hypothetical protein